MQVFLSTYHVELLSDYGIFLPLLIQLVNVCTHIQTGCFQAVHIRIGIGQAYLCLQEILGIPSMCIKHFYWLHLTMLRAQRDNKQDPETEVERPAQGGKLAESEAAASGRYGVWASPLRVFLKP